MVKTQHENGAPQKTGYSNKTLSLRFIVLNKDISVVNVNMTHKAGNLHVFLYSFRRNHIKL